MSNDWREEEGEEVLNFDSGKGKKGKVAFVAEEDEREEETDAFQEDEDGDLLNEEDDENSFDLYDATTDDEELGYQM